MLRREGQRSACVQVARPSWELAQRVPLEPPIFPLEPPIFQNTGTLVDSPRPQPCGHTDSLAAQQAQGLLLQSSQGIRGDDGSMA